MSTCSINEFETNVSEWASGILGSGAMGSSIKCLQVHLADSE